MIVLVRQLDTDPDGADFTKNVISKSSLITTTPRPKSHHERDQTAARADTG
jgi:hypothetical protein